MATKARHLKSAIQLWIADQRKAGGYSSADLAGWTGLTEDTARAWESRGRPSADAVAILERKFGTPAPKGEAATAGDQAELIAVLIAQTAAITTLVEELRLARLQQVTETTEIARAIGALGGGRAPRGKRSGSDREASPVPR